MSSLTVAPLSLRDCGHSHSSHAHAHQQLLVRVDGLLELEIEGRGQRLVLYLPQAWPPQSSALAATLRRAAL